MVKFRLSAKKILIVDDEPDIVFFYSETLRTAGYRITESQDGVEAMFKMRNSSFDLIITDIEMPRLTGDKMISSILSMKMAQAKLPVIISSGCVDLQLVEKFKGQTMDCGGTGQLVHCSV